MPMSIPVLETWTWPWPVWTLHAMYIGSGLLFALHYIPQIRIAWRQPDATRTAQSLATWCVWTLCRMIGFAYGVYVVHDLFFVLVIGADLLGRFLMVALIVRANLLTRHKTATGAIESPAHVRPRGVQPDSDFQPARNRRLIAYQPQVLVLGRARGS